MAENTRIQRITEKLNSLNLKPESEKQTRLETCETRFRHLESKVGDFFDFHQKRTGILREQIRKLQSECEDEQIAFTQILEEKAKRLTDIMASQEKLINNEMQVSLKGTQGVRPANSQRNRGSSRDFQRRARNAFALTTPARPRHRGRRQRRLTRQTFPSCATISRKQCAEDRRAKSNWCRQAGTWSAICTRSFRH